MEDQIGTQYVEDVAKLVSSAQQIPEQSSAVQPMAPPETPAQDTASYVPVQMPSLGRTVHYILTKADCEKAIAARKAAGPWQEGNEPREGAEVAMVIVAVWGSSPTSCVNGHVLLDGNDGLWVLSRNQGTEPGTWHWPERV